MTKKNEPNLFELLARLPAQLATLLRLEYENAKREITSKLKQLGLGAVFIILALFVVFFALGSFVVAAIAGIAVALPVWLAALIVAFALLIIAGLILWFGFNRIQNGNPVPEETLSRFEHDFESMAERVNRYDDEF